MGEKEDITQTGGGRGRKQLWAPASTESDRKERGMGLHFTLFKREFKVWKKKPDADEKKRR